VVRVPPTSRPESAYAALRQRHFLLGAWPWRALAHTALTLPLWVVFAIPMAAVVAPLGGSVAAVARSQIPGAAALLLLSLALGFVLLPLVASPLVAVDRWRARLIDPVSLPAPPPPPQEPGAWLRDRYLTARRWRYAGYLVLVLVLQGCLLAALSLIGTSAVALLAAPVLASREDPVNVGPWRAGDPASAFGLSLLGLALLVGLGYAWTVGACLQVTVLRRTLDTERVDRLAAQLTEVGASRARLVDSFDSERRRIERDLHDGAQQRLVTLAMGLGVPRIEVTDALGPDHPATSGVTAAHEQAKVLMDELRAFVRGIHPQVLTDVGLVAALDQLTAAMPLPVEVSSTITRRPLAHVETTAYFAASEALTNVVRHSSAARAWVCVSREDDDVVVEVRDDGRGGARPRADSGLTWMADRLSAVGGALWLSSPAGGPTVLRMSIPESR